jgi:glutamate-1-semialdehyde 2,1-aminomutase
MTKSLRVAGCGLRVLEEAKRYLVGGVNSPVRAFRHVGGEPLMLVSARGAEVVDHAHARFVDFIMGWGALILGHNHPAVVRSLRGAIDHGVLLGLTHPPEVELARFIVEAVPSVEQVRFAVSGTEACMTAIRLARAHTGRAKILTFDGCYHGHSDSLMARNTAGIPGLLAKETLTAPLNDTKSLKAIIKRHAYALAAVIIEPVAANMGVVAPEAGYLKLLRRLSAERGILLIFDEVVTGFRLSIGGAQALLHIRPDLTTFGKIIGGGMPIGALGGARRLMRRLAPEGDVYHGGTFAGHPLAMAAGIATLRELTVNPPYERLEEMTRSLTQRLLDAARGYGVPLCINRAGSMFTPFFSDGPICNMAQAKASQRSRFAAWANALRRRGVLVPPSPFEALFVSSAHTQRHIDRMLQASTDVFKSMRS